MNLPNKITVFRFACIPFLLAASLIQFPYHWSVALVIYFIACMSDKAGTGYGLWETDGSAVR